MERERKRERDEGKKRDKGGGIRVSVGGSSVRTRNKRTNALVREGGGRGKSLEGKREYSRTGVRRERGIKDASQRTEGQRRGERSEDGRGFVEASGSRSCCETRWRTTLRQTAEGAEQERNEASGCTSPPSTGPLREEESGSYLRGAGSARGEGSTQGRKLQFLNLWVERPNALKLPPFFFFQ